MIKNDKQLGTPFVNYTDTKSGIEALSGVRVGATAVATDNPTAPFGVYINTGWHWYATGSVGGGSITAQDEGVSQGTFTTLNVVGAQADISVSGTVARLFITGSSGGNRLYIDQSAGTSDTYGALVGLVNGSNTIYKVSAGSYVSSSLGVYLNGQLQTQGTGEDWVELFPSSGTFSLNVAPPTGSHITAQYLVASLGSSDADTLDGQHGSYYQNANNLNAGTVPTARLGMSGFIYGLQMTRVSGTALTVKTGGADIQSLGYVVQVSSDIAKSSLSLSASTMYHVYLYLNSGTPDIEIVTTAPASPYLGTARSKTADTSRRYIGSIITDGSSNILGFYHNWQSGYIAYQNQQDAAPFRVLTNGLATTETNVSCTSVIPPTSKLAQLKFNNTTAGNYLHIGNSEDNITLANGVGVFVVNPLNYPIVSDVPLDSSQNFSYLFEATPPSTGAYIDCYGYKYER